MRLVAVTVLVNLLVSGVVVLALRWPDPQPIRLVTVIPETALPPTTAVSQDDASQAGHADRAALTGADVPEAESLLDINTASAGELEALPGIGPVLAARVVEYREANGAFSTIEELMNVPGIGEKTLDGLRGLITVH